MTKQADLNAYLLEGASLPPGALRLSSDLKQWMDGSARFTGFVEGYRDKIRKKIRVVQDAESLLDLRAELAVACRLLSDRRFDVAYEPLASAKTRGPDFGVTYRVNRAFNVEVARIRVEENSGAPVDVAQKEDRVFWVMLNKLGQMQPGKPNLLAIQVRADLVQAIDLARMMTAVKAKAEAKDPVFYAVTRYPSPAAFYKDLSRLSGLVLWDDGAQQLWVNKQARPLLDEKVQRLVADLLPRS